MLKKILLVILVSLFFAAATVAQGTSTSTTTATTPTTSEKTKKPPIFRPNKDQILQVQKILKEKKFYDGEANGVYNDPTRAGIRTFQKGNGLKETGTLNRATLEKFGIELTEKQKLIPVSPNSFATPATGKSTSSSASVSTSTGTKTTVDTTTKKVIFRATVDQIKAAQKLLKSKSFYAGDETGKLDDPTREGLRKYQDTNGIKVTGTLNQVTLEKMGIPLTDKQKADAATATPGN